MPHLLPVCFMHSLPASLNRCKAVLVIVLMSAIFCVGQQNPDLEVGMKPYGSYQGGDVDAVNLSNGNVMLNIPIASYPQRGMAGPIRFSILSNNKTWFAKERRIDGSTQLNWAWWAYEPSSPGRNRGDVPGAGMASSVGLTLTRTITANYGPTGTITSVVREYSISLPDGSSHELREGMDALDGSGFYFYNPNPSAQDAESQPSLLIDRTGLRYSFAPNRAPFIPQDDRDGCPSPEAPSRTTYVCKYEPAMQWTEILNLEASQVQDPNGNYVTQGPTIVDTIGRTLFASDTQTDLADCPPETTAVSRYWLPGATSSFLKLCSATLHFQTAFNVTGITEGQTGPSNGIYPNAPDPTMIVALVLPNHTKWHFEYDSYGDLHRLTLPTGGTIDYTYENRTSSFGGSRFVSRRTVNANDGSAPSVWSYSWGTNSNGTVTNRVTDPVGNFVDHTFLQRATGYYETNTDYFDITGQKLKTVITTYELKNNGWLVTPSTITTRLYAQAPDQSNVFSTSVLAHDTNGNLLQQLDYNYDGNLLRNAVTSYHPNDAHALDLPEKQVVYSVLTGSTDVSCGAGCEAQTTYVYDAYDSSSRFVTSGINTQRLTTGLPMQPGNLTQVQHWLNTGGTATTHNSVYDTGILQSTSDPLNHVTSYEYDCAGSLVSKTIDALGHVSQAGHDCGTGLVTSITDQNNRQSLYSWDGMMRPLSGTFPDGGQTSFVYTDTPGALSVQRTQLIDSQHSRVDVAEFDGLGRTNLTQLKSDPEGITYADTLYDAAGRVYCGSNPYRTGTASTNGTTCTEYDGIGRRTLVTKQDGSVVHMQYSKNCTAQTDEAGNNITRCTDSLGRLIEVDEPGSATQGATAATGTVSISGSVQSRTDAVAAAPGTATVTIGGSLQAYDPGCGGDPECAWMYDAGWVKVTVNGFAVTTNYGSLHTPRTAEDVADALATLFNTTTGSPVTATPVGSTLSLTARASGSATNYSLTAASATTKTSYFSWPSFHPQLSAGTLTGGRDPGSTTQYDSGSVTITVNGVAKSVSYSQGSTTSGVASSLASAFNGDSGSPVTASSSGGTLTFVSKAIGAGANYTLAASQVYNSGSFSQPSFAISPSANSLTGGSDGGLAPYVTRYKYSATGNLLCVEQRGGTAGNGASCDSSDESLDAGSPWRIRRFAYDSLGRLTRSKNPESGVITYNYNADGFLTAKTDARGITITYTPDALHRMSAKTYSNGDPAVTYTYDDVTPGVNGIGRRTGMVDSSGSTAWSYDTLGRVSSEVRHIGSANATFSYGYNLDGSVRTISYPSGSTIEYHPTGAGRVDSVRDTAHNLDYATQAAYTPGGALSSVLNGGTIATTNSYNSRLQPMTLSAAGAQTVMSLTYDFHLGNGDNGNIYQVRNNLDDLDPTRPVGTVNYEYDGLNRLKSAQTTGADCSVTSSAGALTKNWGTSFTIDPWGNLTAINVTKCAAIPFASSAAANNQLAGSSYDAAGNLQSGGYSYDAEGRLTSVSGVVSYTYDGDGTRVKKSNGKLYWTGAGPEPLLESDLGGSFTAEYIYFNGKRIARRDLPAGTVHYYFSDHLGSTNVVTSASGVVQDESYFYPYGGERRLVDADPNSYKFTGKEHDAETGLDYFGARYYGSNMGRFLTPDWADKAVTVPYAEFGDPQTLNLYGYVRNNPLWKADLDGHGWRDSLQFLGQELVGVGKQLVNTVTSNLNALARSNYDLNKVGPAFAQPVPAAQIPQAHADNLGQAVGMGVTLGATIVAPAAKGAPATNLAERAEEIHGALDPIAQRMRTTAVANVTNADGTASTLVSSSRPTLSPAQRAVLNSGETPVSGAGHAEETILNSAQRNGQTVNSMGVSRTPCASCAQKLKDAGVQVQEK